MEQHIKIVALLYIIMGALGLVAAVAALVLIGGGSLLSGEPDAAIAGGTCALAIAGFIAVLSLPNIIAGIGLKNRKEWARILTIILSALNIFNFPFGTALGVYAFWALLNDESRAYFAR